MPPSSADFWDEMYAGTEYRYGTEPNEFLMAQVGAVRGGGRVLCLGDGEGRNGVWLAEQGFEVTSIDASEVGLRKARALAATRGVYLETVHATLPAHPLGEERFDAVVLVFLHLSPEIRTKVHAQAVAALAPGGVLLLEAFTPEQLRFESGGPRRGEMLYTPNMLIADFRELEIEVVEATERPLREGQGHDGMAAVLRLRARRPRTTP